MNRVLVIRGGAIGDFILTLPALKLLRENFPQAHIEILGYKQIIALAENRYYACATRSINYAPLSRFFARNAELPADLIAYFASFDLILSYLFDPDEIFESNLKRCGVQRFISQSPKINNQEHAARQLARPLKQIGLCVADAAPVLYPNDADRLAAREFLGRAPTPLIAIHPGSGSETKNWPIENWITLGEHLLSSENPRVTLVVVSGEADERQTARLRSLWKEKPARFAMNLALPHLAALLEGSIFVGHDSGISHLAAAAGARCVLLFGPTDPAIWGPANRNVTILRAPEGNLRKLRFETVRDALDFRFTN
jgi:heptosyltransferase III